MNQEEFSLLFHRAQVNLVAFKMLYEPEAFEAMHRMVEMAIADEREACAKACEQSDRYRGEYFAALIRERGNQ